MSTASMGVIKSTIRQAYLDNIPLIPEIAGGDAMDKK